MKLYTNDTLPDQKKQKMVARFIFDGMHVEEIKKLLRKEFEKIRFITDDDSSIIALRKVPNIPIINQPTLFTIRITTNSMQHTCVGCYCLCDVDDILGKVSYDQTVSAIDKRLEYQRKFRKFSLYIYSIICDAGFNSRDKAIY